MIGNEMLLMMMNSTEDVLSLSQPVRGGSPIPRHLAGQFGRVGLQVPKAHMNMIMMVVVSIQKRLQPQTIRRINLPRPSLNSPMYLT